MLSTDRKEKPEAGACAVFKVSTRVVARVGPETPHRPTYVWWEWTKCG